MLPQGSVLLADSPSWSLFPAAMLLLSGALVSGPYALITTAVSADLVSTRSSLQSRSQMLAGGHLFHHNCCDGWSLIVRRSVSMSALVQTASKDPKSLLKQIRGHGRPVL